MSVYKIVLTLAILGAVSNAQRPFYAGLRAIGYPKGASNVLTNRFGETANLPIEARGDGALINRFNQMPEDQRPFWYLNRRQYDELRRNPQTYKQRPNLFVDRNNS